MGQISPVSSAIPRGLDCSGVLTSLGHNLFGDLTGCTVALQPTDLLGEPGLSDFTDDGKPGRGHFPLLPESPAIDAGDDMACPSTDQLGHPRVGPCDIGAIEFQPASPPALAIRLNQSSFTPDQTLRVTLDLSNPGPILTTDVYVGVILPNGVDTLFLTNFSPLEGVMTTLDSDPRTFARLLRTSPGRRGCAPPSRITSPIPSRDSSRLAPLISWWAGRSRTAWRMAASMTGMS